MMNRYIKKPVVIEAMQYFYPASDELKNWLSGSFGEEKETKIPISIDAVEWEKTNYTLKILPLEHRLDVRGIGVATHGDYIIKGIKGEFYPCKPDIFHATYELLE